MTLASRDNYNLIFSNASFPDVNAGTTLLIQRDGSGTGEVRIYDTALTVNGTIGGSGRLQLGSSPTGTLTVSNTGTLSPGSSAGTFTLDGNLILNTGADYAWEILAGPGGYTDHQSDLTVINGDLTLGANTTIYITQTSRVHADGSQEYTLFQYSGTLTGWNPANVTLDYTLAGHLMGATVNWDSLGKRIYLTGLIPEPCTATLLAAAGLLALRRRRQG